MDAIVAALIGLVGMLIAGGFVWLRSEIVPRLDRIEGRLDRMNERMDERFDDVSNLMRSQGERIARVEGREEAVTGG
ncbi:MAG: hypothetical protein OXP08_01475 [bacterium]|nr:hypothetical protein [bacterium]